MVRSLSAVAMVLAAGVFLVTFITRDDLSPQVVTLDQPTAVGSILLGQPCEFWVDAHASNQKSGSVRVLSATTTCGCLEVIEAPEVVGSSSAATFVLRGHPDSRFASSLQRMDLTLEDGSTASVHVGLRPVPPFEGWPGHVELHKDPSGNSFFVLNEEYSQSVLTAVAWSKSGRSFHGKIDPRTGAVRFVIPDDIDGTLEVVVVFGLGERDMWSGPAVTQTVSESDARK